MTSSSTGMQASDIHDLPIVLGITGASGAAYAVRLLQTLLVRKQRVHVIVSGSGQAVLKQELGQVIETSKPPCDAIGNILRSCDQWLELPGEETAQALELAPSLLQLHGISDYFTPVASGSYLTRGMVICPCSGATMSAVAHSASQNLVQRAAEVHLKEHRKLIVVPRETPLSSFQIENMLRLSQAGVVVLPAAPGWYHGARKVAELVDFVVDRILDQLGVSNPKSPRWAVDPD